MKIQDISNGSIVLEFEPGDAYRPAQVCAAADQAVAGNAVDAEVFDLPAGGPGIPGTYVVSQLYGALAGTFLASALACEAFYRFSGDRQDRFGLRTLRHYSTGQMPHEVEEEAAE